MVAFLVYSESANFPDVYVFIGVFRIIWFNKSGAQFKHILPRDRKIQIDWILQRSLPENCIRIINSTARVRETSGATAGYKYRSNFVGRAHNTVQAKENSPVFTDSFREIDGIVQFLIVFNPVCCVMRIGYGKSGNVCAQAPSSLGQDHLINSLYKIERGFFEFRIDRCNSELLREISKVDKVSGRFGLRSLCNGIMSGLSTNLRHLFSSCLAV